MVPLETKHRIFDVITRRVADKLALQSVAVSQSLSNLSPDTFDSQFQSLRLAIGLA